MTQKLSPKRHQKELASTQATPRQQVRLTGHHRERQCGPSLHELRAEHDLSIRALAEKSGLAINTLSLIENGKTSPASARCNKSPRARCAYHGLL